MQETMQETMQERFKEFNTFLFPLPRDMRCKFVVVQLADDENYQAHKENAPVRLCMVY